MPKLALFDLDNTLLEGDSDHAWGEFLVETGWVNATNYKDQNNKFYQQYNAGNLDIHEFLRFALAPLKKIPKETLFELRSQFLQKILPGLVSAKIHARLKAHQAHQNQCIIITATNSFITQPIAEYFQVPLIATEPEIINNQFTGEVKGTACFQDGKITCLNNWLKTHSSLLTHFDETLFYSDSINDLPLFNLVQKPIAVNPDSQLEALAISSRWELIRH